MKRGTRLVSACETTLIHAGAGGVGLAAIQAFGTLRVAVDRAYPLAEAAAAHAYVESRQAFGRVLFLP